MFETERGAIIIAASIRASVMEGEKTSNTNFQANFKRFYEEIVQVLKEIQEERMTK
jgi:hypothetical protein